METRVPNTAFSPLNKELLVESYRISHMFSMCDIIRLKTLYLEAKRQCSELEFLLERDKKSSNQTIGRGWPEDFVGENFVSIK
jgi:hypothetical protein